VELAGYTSRVGNMLDVFEEVGRGHYEKPSIKGNSKSGQRQWETLRLTVKNGLPIATGIKTIDDNNQEKRPSNQILTLQNKLFILGELTEYSDGVISLDDVPIVTPNFDVVVPSLSLKVTRGSIQCIA
jgi:ATP-binding cassette subfamily D (ALD) protein 2